MSQKPLPRQLILPRLANRERQIDGFAKFLRGLPLESAWCVQVSEHKPTRSDAQNRFLWGYVYPTICAHLEGWTAEDVHEYMLGEHFGWQEISGLGRRRIKPLRRSSKLNKQEFSDYVAFIQRRMAEHGVYIEDPQEAAA